MSDPASRPSRREARAIGTLIGAAIDPVCAKRGFATADLIAAWGDVVGPRYARSTQPEKLSWPRGEQAGKGGTLVVRVDAGMAIYLQHEAELIRERVNGFLGFGAVAAIRIVQGPVAAAAPAAGPSPPRLSASAETAVASEIASLDDGPLREALQRLGRAIYGKVERS